MTNGTKSPGPDPGPAPATPPGLDRDLLAAFVDGALSPEDAAAVVMHLADHPQDQAHVDDLIAANEALAAAFAAPLHEPVPEAIRATIMGDAVAGSGDRAVVRFRPRRPVAVLIGGALALAASVAAVAILMTGGPGGSVASGARLLAVGPVDQGSDLGRVLADLPTLEPVVLDGGQQIMVLATLRTADGRFCREVEIVDQAAARIDMGIACSGAGGGWTIGIAVQEVLHQDAGDGFVTASGTGPGSLGQFLDRQGAGEVLSPEAEAQAIGSGWTQ